MLQWTTKHDRHFVTVAHSILVSFLLVASLSGEPTHTIKVTVRTRTGGSLSGLVVDYNDHGVVLVHGQTPYVFSWRSLTPGSSYVIQRDLLAFKRGGAAHLSANDRFTIGMIALDNGRNDLAAIEFRRALALDARLQPRIDAAYDAFRAEKKRALSVRRSLTPLNAEPLMSDDNDNAEPTGTGRAMISPPVIDGANGGQARFDRVMQAYRTFGEEVGRVLGKTISSTETEHFLIWTDFAQHDLPQLASWCEAMYAALTKALGISDDQQVFLAKCPMFCFRSRARFRKFARYFDGLDARNSIGYTRSIESNGHTHVVLLHQGTDAADADRFACTLVHEGTHAFLHRLYSTRLIPHWVNEGFADLMADRVLGERCGKRADASLLAQCFVRYDWPIRDMLESVAPIGVEQYPLAHSVIRFLHDRDAAGLAQFIEQLKSGTTLTQALANAYDGLTLDSLEQGWRQWVRSTASPDAPEGKTPRRPGSGAARSSKPLAGS